MGTRNLTMVVSKGQTKVAQYCQWDGYPSGQGMTVLAFCRARLATPRGRNAFRAKLKLVRFGTEPEISALYKSIGIMVEWISMEQGEQLKQKLPQLSRDTGAKILDVIQANESELLLNDASSFAGESLFCEWAYVVDLGARVLEVYKGFNEKPVPAGERFAHLPKDKDYYPVRCIAKFNLSDLPSDEAFLALEKSTEEAAE